MDKLLEKSFSRLQDTGGRMTTQRRLILQTLDELSAHPTADELFELVRQHDHSIHLATVYRTLRWLEDEGIVSPRFFDPAAGRDRFDPNPSSEHYHFVCNNCQRVIEFDTLLVNTIKAQFELHSGAEVSSGSVMLSGLCQRCRR